MMKTDQITMTFKDKTIDFPLLTSTMGYPVADMSTLGQHGIYTLDPGFLATAACTSEITYIDGTAGKLYYRGYGIEHLANTYDHESVMGLLLHERIPTEEEKQQLTDTLKLHSAIPASVHRCLATLPTTLHPVSMLITLISILPDTKHYDLNDTESRTQAAYSMVAKLPELSAMVYRHTQGLKPVKRDPSLSYAGSFLHMMFDTTPTDTMIRAMDKILILHADHEQNASTSTVRMAGSTGTHPYAALIAGIAALWGPAHGGANESCLTMLETIGHTDNIETYIDKAKDKNDPFRLMGFGHRVYKNYDPRAQVMRTICHQVLEDTDTKTPLLEVAKTLENIAREDSYFVDRNLYPNVDFYSGITLNAMGIPKNFFTVIFALSRTVGWMAHWLEMHAQKNFRISRPRQRYIGPTPKDD